LAETERRVRETRAGSRLLVCLLAEEVHHRVRRRLAQARRRRYRVSSATEREGRTEIERFRLGCTDHRAHEAHLVVMMMMMMVMLMVVHRVRVAARGQAQRVRSQQRRLVVAARAGAAAEAQRIGSHEAGSASDGGGGSRGHVRRRRDLLEQAHANVINGRGADRAVTRGITVTASISGIGIRDRRHVH